jgi:acyl-CoA dehydrogenase
MICRRAAALFDASDECGADANMAKLLAPKPDGMPRRQRCQPTAASPLPANTTSSANGAKSASTRTARISTNLILAYIGQHVLGMPRSY